MRVINKTLAGFALAGALAASTAAGAVTITTLYNTGVDNAGVSMPGAQAQWICTTPRMVVMLSSAPRLRV